MNKQLELDKKYLRIAKIWSENSYAIRKKVGCIIVKDNMIISDGYNGTPSGFENVCEDLELIYADKIIKYDDIEVLNQDMKKYFGEYALITKPYVLHAEANAITKLAKSNNSSEGATLYVTCEPCLNCSKLIIQSGIKRVVYNELYREHDGINLLKRVGIKVEQINI